VYGIVCMEMCVWKCVYGNVCMELCVCGLMPMGVDDGGDLGPMPFDECE
jgi:hypothetical protein